MCHAEQNKKIEKFFSKTSDNTSKFWNWLHFIFPISSLMCLMPQTDYRDEMEKIKLSPFQNFQVFSEILRGKFVKLILLFSMTNISWINPKDTWNWLNFIFSISSPICHKLKQWKSNDNVLILIQWIYVMYDINFYFIIFFVIFCDVYICTYMNIILYVNI